MSLITPKEEEDIETMPIGEEDIANNIEENLLSDEPTDTGLDEFDTVDPEIEAIKARVKEMEEEAQKLKDMQKAAEETLLMASPPNSTLVTSSPGEKSAADTDACSVHVGNVDYAATATDLEQHFHGCGSVNRVTILCDKFTGQPKGFAYVEFAEKEALEHACQLTDSLFKGRQIRVTPKRTNIPGISTSNRFPRTRFRGRGRGFYGGFPGGFGGYSPRPRGRGGFRSRRAQWYSPY